MVSSYVMIDSACVARIAVETEQIASIISRASEGRYEHRLAPISPISSMVRLRQQQIGSTELRVWLWLMDQDSFYPREGMGTGSGMTKSNRRRLLERSASTEPPGLVNSDDCELGHGKEVVPCRFHSSIIDMVRLLTGSE